MTHPQQDSFWARVAGRRRPADDQPEPRLPVPVVEPRIPADVLIAQARARGEADARGHVRDGWSFTDPFTAAQDAEAGTEDYIRHLRERRRAAVASARDRQLAVLRLTEPLRDRREEARQRMADARTMMGRLAGQEAWLREPDLNRPPAAEGEPAEEVPADDPTWEGETTALGLRWRVLIIAGLVAVLTPLYYLVFQHFLTGFVPSAATWALAVSSAVLMVVGPHVTALMVRAAHATGGDRALRPAAAVLAIAWATMAVFLGMVSAAIVGVDHVRLAALDITGTTLVLMFIAGLVVGGAVAFMIGLARRHPYQEAYASARRRFEDLDERLQALILRLDPGFADIVADNGDRQPETLIEAIEAGYRAAEFAYFDALSATMGDPTFTEAVEHRISLLRREEEVA